MDDAFLGSEPAQLAVIREAPPERGAVGDDLVEFQADNERRELLDRGAAQVVPAPDREGHADTLVAVVGREEHVRAGVVRVLVHCVGAGERHRGGRADVERAGTGDASHRIGMLESARFGR